MSEERKAAERLLLRLLGVAAAFAVVRWVLPESDALNIANSICSAVDHDGTIYIAFDNALVSISPAGQLQWKAQANRADIFWPAEIIIDNIFVDVRYDNHPELDGVYDTARFTKDGFLLKIIQTQGAGN